MRVANCGVDKVVKMRKAFKGGVKPGHDKRTSDLNTVELPLPTTVVIPMLQHVGAPCVPLVKKGDKVLVGQKIGHSDALISAPVHSSVSGTVSSVGPVASAGGFDMMAVEIKTDGKQEVHESVKPPGDNGREDLIKSIRESGLVGLGGAGFPTSVKLSPPPAIGIDILIINGAECEPYITSDYREMMENPEGIIKGTLIVMDIIGVKKAYIGVEKNKPEAIRLLASLAKKHPGIEIVPLRTRYPQGGEKQLIYAVTGRRVPAGKLPMDVGVLVQNVNTVSFIADFLETGMPLVKRRITVDGGAVAKAMNLMVPVGTQFKDIFEFCGGFVKEPARIIMGGPMMGVAQYSMESSVLKQNNAILALSKDELDDRPESACIRCGKCVSACPMSLMPLYINMHVMKGDIEGTIKYHVNDCMECGCCSYVCPASRHLVQSIRYAKAELRKMAAKKGVSK